MKYYDIVVIGAGPAGLSFLANVNGGRIALVEKEFLPRRKACGGVLKQRTVELLPEIPQPIFVEPARLGYVFMDMDNRLAVRFAKKLYNVHRARFDAWLVERITQRFDLYDGCILRDLRNDSTGYVLTVYSRETRRKYRIRTSAVIGGDGIFSCVRRMLNIPKAHFYVGIQFYIEDFGMALDDFYYIRHSSVSPFYSWLIPKNGDLLAGFAFSPRRDMRGPKEHFVKMLKGILGRGLKIRPAPSGPVAKGYPRDVNLGHGRIFLIGEAAGLISPMSGEGISHALLSGRFCAESLNHDEGMEGYVRRMAPLLEEIKAKYWLKQMLSDPDRRRKYLENCLKMNQPSMEDFTWDLPEE